MDTSYLIVGLDFIAAFLLGAAMIKLLLKVAYHNRLFDLPDVRKVHQIPVPRLGGMSFLPTIVVVIAFTIGSLYQFNIVHQTFMENILFVRVAYLMGAAMILYVVGVADDLSDIGYKTKFIFQFLAAVVMVLSGLWIKDLYGLFGLHAIPDWVGIPLTLVMLVFVMNALNLIDGIDGLASGLAIVSLACFCAIFIFERRFVYAMTAMTSLGVVSAFWLFNVFGKPEKETKLYMGDTGSLTLGLILCFLILVLGTFIGHNGPTRNCKYFTIAFSSLMIPLLDVVRLVIYRIKHHRNPFKPDMNHVHHKLLQLGFSPRKTLWVILAADVALILLNAFFSMYVNVNILLVADVVIYYLAIKLLTEKIISKLGSGPGAGA
ncbi:MAG: undecaprenyl/decaprenyl-phosphate alpha-N-acetylglucosaminyl 1-phosphate transferase [Bacteroidales bacterium]|nr:undecaprenyl/decaprenyl-phosphate alpha-N-acetylglucosaminyl 1-phosphate transferase [Bacteroidales bacterium]